MKQEYSFHIPAASIISNRLHSRCLSNNILSLWNHCCSVPPRTQDVCRLCQTGKGIKPCWHKHIVVRYTSSRLFQELLGNGVMGLALMCIWAASKHSVEIFLEDPRKRTEWGKEIK